MSATINFFKSAFKNDCDTFVLEENRVLKEYLKLDWQNCLVSVNGKKADENYILQNDDVVTIRQYPSNEDACAVINWIVDPVGSLITGAATNNWKGSVVGNIENYIDGLFSQSSTSSNSSTESIPTISGAKNQNGADKVIPLLIGESLYAPIYCAQAYTDIDPTDGSDGENQYFHALYCLGYKDIDLKRVNLGIYPLTIDRQNGTSKKSLDCTNYESKYSRQSIKCEYEQTYLNNDDNISISYNNNYQLTKLVIKLPVKKSDYYDIQSIDSIASYNFSVMYRAVFSQKVPLIGNSIQFAEKIPCVVNSISLVDNCITIEATPQKTTDYKRNPTRAYVNVSGSAVISCTAKAIFNTLHYDINKYNQQLELRQNEEEVGLYPQKVVQETFNTELLHPEGADALIVQPFSAKYPQKVQIEIQFQNLIKYNDDGSKEDNEVEIGIGYSLDGGATYKPFSDFSAPNSAIKVTDNGTGIFADGSGTYKITKFKGQKNKAMRFVAEKNFTFSEVFNTDTVTKLKNNAIEFKILRIREDKSESNNKLQYKVYFSAIRTWCYDYNQSKDAGKLIAQKPLAEKYMKMTARLGFKIKAGDELNGQLDELNVVMRSRARYCTITEDKNGEKKYSWSNDTQPTNNPASLALMVLQHPMRGEYAYADDQLDLDSFGKFYEWCNQTDAELSNSDCRKYTANGILSKEIKTLDLVNQILAVGHGKLVMNGNKYAVWFDHPQDTPVMILNNQNVLEANNSKAFTEEIDGFSVKFIDSINDYQEDTQICVPKNTTKAVDKYKLENLDVPWITDIARVYRYCMYNLACRKLRPEVWNRKVGVDGNLIEIGNLVLLQDDTLSVGIGDGAEITEVTTSDNYITSIKVDYPFAVSDTSQTYGVKIQHADSSYGVKIRTYELKTFSKTGEYTELTFAGSGVSLDEIVVPNIGDIVAFGLFERITTEAICFEKQEQGDGSFQLKLVPYQEDVYFAEYGSIPEFKTNVTSPKYNGNSISSEIPKPTYDDITTIAQTVNNETTEELNLNVPPDIPTVTAIAEKDGIRIRCDVDGKKLNNSIKEYSIILYKGDNGTVYSFSGTEFFYSFNRSSDGYPEKNTLDGWKVKAKAQNFFELESAYSDATDINTDKYGTWKFAFSTININKETLDRTVIMNMTVSNAGSDAIPLYGDTKFKISIKRNGYVIDKNGNETSESIADSKYYAPNLTVTAYPSGTKEKGDYKGNENNYKDTENSLDYVISGSAFTQTLPLYGQEEFVLSNGNWISSGKKRQNTEYLYKITAYNESGFEITLSDFAITALCSGLTDIVYSHDYYKNLYVKKLSAINANLGLISQGGFGDFSGWNNFWALSYLTAEESGVTGGVKEGAFKVGDSRQYIMVIPPRMTFGVGAEAVENNTDNFMIKIKAGNIELKSSGQTSFENGTYITDDTDPTKRMHLTSIGMEVEKFENGEWTVKASVTADTNGNMIITNVSKNDSSLPKIGIALSEASIIYHLEENTKDDSGGNAAGFTFNVDNYSESSMIVNYNKLMNGSVKKSLAAECICGFTNTDIIIGNNIIDIKNGTVKNPASEWNSKLDVTYFRLGDK